MPDFNFFRENSDDIEFCYASQGAGKPTVPNHLWPLSSSAQMDRRANLTGAVPCGLSRRALSRACSYMENNIGESFTLSDLASAAGVSRFHFSRLFRVSTCESPMRYLFRLRIERAIEMLERSDHKVCEVAAILGFSDQSHFARTFRRITGVSPKMFVYLQSGMAQGAYRHDGGAWIGEHLNRVTPAPRPLHQKTHNDSNCSTQMQFRSLGAERNGLGVTE
jgi:AraC family transcriptional regulator